MGTVIAEAAAQAKISTLECELEEVRYTKSQDRLLY